MEPEFSTVKEAGKVLKDPTTYSWLTYLWVVVLSAWGGTVRYLQSIKGTKVPLRKLLVDLTVGGSTSIFVGVITFFFCEAANFEPLWTAVCVAVTGHMGAEALVIISNVVRKRMGDQA